MLGEPIEFGLQRLELQHEQFDAGIVECRDAFGDLAITADQAGQRAAVGPNPAGIGQHLVHLRFRVGAGRISRLSASTNDCRYCVLGDGLGLGLTGDTMADKPYRSSAPLVSRRAGPR